MKLFFLSDIHGSAYYLNKALERFKEEKADYIMMLGDYLYHGARNPLTKEYSTKEAIRILNDIAHRIIAVKGNCDSEVDQMVLDFPMMAIYSNVLWNKRRLFLTHGHIYNEYNLPKLSDGDIFISGHSHIPKVEKVDGLYLINPGSISLPKGNSPHSYGILDSNTISLKDLEGKTFSEINIME